MMRFRAVRRHAESDEVPEYWITYSDLMVSLLMAFALLLFLAMARVQTEIRVAEQTVSTLNAALKSSAEALEGSGALIAFDTTTGTLTMNSEVLFNYGSASLRPEAMQPIQQVATRLIPALLAKPAVDTMLQEITIEGHTDTVGSYMSNLRLSQDRAYAVMQAMVEFADSLPNARRFETLVASSGKSEVRPIVRADGTVDAAKSRRIEIHIRLRNDAILKQVLRAAENQAGRQ